MPSDAEQLATHTHFTRDEAETLLDSRTLSGSPADHDHPAILITDDEVIVETRHAFEDTRAPSAIELAFVCGASVEQMRRDQHAAAESLTPDDDP